MRLEEFVLISIVALLLFIPALVGVLIFRRTLRGEDLRDSDWRFLFVKSKDEVLTAAYRLKVGVGLLFVSL